MGAPMPIWSAAYKDNPPEYLQRHGKAELACSRRNPGRQNPCRANYLALTTLGEQLLGIARARLDGVEGVAVELATSTPGYTVVLFIDDQGRVYHGDELSPTGDQKNTVPGCRVFGRSYGASGVAWQLCYHVVAAYAARALALELDDELVEHLKAWWRELDAGMGPNERSTSLEVAADALYYHLKDLAGGGSQLEADRLPPEREAELELREDLTVAAVGRPAEGVRLRFPAGPSQAAATTNQDRLSWPEPPDDLTDEERLLVPEGVVYYPAGDELEDIAAHIRLCRERGRPCNILLPGEAAAGKTTLAAFIAQRLGQPLVEVHCSASMDHAALIGAYVKVGDQWAWSDGEIIRAARRGWVVYIDEVHRLPAEIGAVIHGLLDHRRLAVLADCHDPQLRYVKAHPRFTVIASGNEGDHYRALPMDPAFRSRWHVVYLADLPAKTRQRILVERCGVGAQLAEQMVRVQDLLWRLYRDGQTPYPPDMRSLVDWGDHAAARGGTVEAVWHAAVHALIDKVAGMDPETRRLVADRIENVFGPPPKRVRQLIALREEGDAA